MIAFYMCGDDGHSREYRALHRPDGTIKVIFGVLEIKNPSPMVRAAAAVALGVPIPPCVALVRYSDNVVFIADYR